MILAGLRIPPRNPSDKGSIASQRITPATFKYSAASEKLGVIAFALIDILCFLALLFMLLTQNTALAASSILIVRIKLD